jgi:hypothetical protein
MSFRDADKLVEKDLASAVILQNWVENIQRTGSFSDRRPDLGSMHNCGFCGRRHRMIGPRCSNADYATTQRAWSEEKGFHQTACEQRVVEQIFGKKMFRKVMHKRHGQNRNFQVRAMATRMQADSEFVIAAAKDMQVPPPSIAAIPTFARDYIAFLENIEQRRIRGQRRIAQQVNRGTRPGGSRYHAHVKRIRHPKDGSAGESALPVRVPEQVPVSDPA